MDIEERMLTLDCNVPGAYCPKPIDYQLTITTATVDLRLTSSFRGQEMFVIEAEEEERKPGQLKRVGK